MAKSAFSLKAIGEGMVAAVCMGFIIIFSPLLRPWYSRWNAGQEDIDRQLPGDNLVLHPRLSSTRAITIRAPAAVIWPWLVQIGYQRAGWYSYDFLEAAIGAADFIDGRSSYRIIPKFQHLQPGDRIYIHPKIPGFLVARVEPGRLLILHNIADTQNGKPFNPEKNHPRHYINNSWVFFFDTIDEKTTRLIVRSRLDYDGSLSNTFIWRALTDPISFVMERKMLLEIKWRAESTERRVDKQKVAVGIPAEMYRP
jgi:hypothetical protein